MAMIPPPNSFVRYLDREQGGYRYIHLLDAEGPLKYPVRFAALAPGSVQSQATIIDEPKPAQGKPQLYLGLLGLWPGFRYYIYHPYNIKTLQFDQRIEDIDEVLTGHLEYEDSPHEAPRYPLWITNTRYPGIQPRNVMFKAGRAQVELNIIRYHVLTDDKLDAQLRSRLVTGEIPSFPINFGGEF